MKMTFVCQVPRAKQSGAVLMIGMVMLLMVSLIAASVIRLSARHTQVVRNEQVRTEAVAAANYALDTVLNQPYNTWASSYKDANPAPNVEVNLGMSKADDSAADGVNVTVKNLTCKRGRVIKNSELLKQSADVYYVTATDASCFGGGGTTPLVIVDLTAVGSPTDDSLCANVLYDMQAQANDPKLLNAAPVVQQGVEVRTDITALSDSCT
jgi:Tfp pilus assembly protein PilX